MLAMLLQEAHSREIHIEPRSLGIVKRGVCTFVQKAHALQNAGANLAIVVNNGKKTALLVSCNLRPRAAFYLTRRILLLWTLSQRAVGHAGRKGEDG